MSNSIKKKEDKEKTEDVLKALSKKSYEHEFYTPLPPGYEAGRTKFIIITGSVMSGLGKGIFSASLARVLEDYGLRASPMKFDGYLNVDAGTLNPYRHGEVFVLDSGLECDMDLGTYERFLDKNLGDENYLTGGKIFTRVLSMERKGKYLGRDVQFIPHVTGEIKRFVRTLALNTKADVVLIEVGGTVGDIENQYFIEAMRQLAYEEGRDNTCFVNLTYILEPRFLGEQKSKAAQLGIRRLMGLGVQPDIIACRATNPVSEKVREKISIYSNVPFKNVLSMHDRESIYYVPDMIREAKLDRVVLETLNITNAREDKKRREMWASFVERLKNRKREITIGITGKYTGVRDSYASILKALEHAGASLRTKVNVKWIETTEIERKPEILEEKMSGVDAIVVPGGFGKRGSDGKIMCVRYARENRIPFLGLCFGFQMAIVEFARDVCGLDGANSTELDKETPYPVIDLLPEQKKIEGLGGNMRLGGFDVSVSKNTLAFKLYKDTTIRERFRHRYECNPKYIKLLEEKGLVFSGRSPKHEIMQILELPDHPFFIATQFHPEFTSRPLRPNPLFKGIVEAAISRKEKK